MIRLANARLQDHQRIRGASRWTAGDLPRTEGTRKLKRRVQARQRLARGHATRAVSATAALAGIEETLRRRFSTQVRITANGAGGTVEFEYYSQAELERLLELWGAL